VKRPASEGRGGGLYSAIYMNVNRISLCRATRRKKRRSREKRRERGVGPILGYIYVYTDRDRNR